jgi:spermidine synthase
MSARHRHSRTLPVRVVQRSDGRRTLEVGGVVQSVLPRLEMAPSETPHTGYWDAMLPAGCPRRALLVGLGGGTVARLLRARCSETALVGIERDAAVLATARAEFDLDAVANLRVELADAFHWVPAAAAREPGTFDYVCLDLFEAGRLVAGTLATMFLRQIAQVMAPGGSLAVNLMVTGRTTEQLHRLERVFLVERTVRVRGNVVAHLRVRPPAEADVSDA